MRLKAIELPEPRREYNKVIITHTAGKDNEMRFGNAFIWSTQYGRDLEHYLTMYAEALKDFPSLKLDNFDCLSVVESGWCKYVAVVRFPVKPDTVMEGWENRDRLHDMVLA